MIETRASILKQTITRTIVELALFKKNGQAFEDLFTSVSKQRWGPDFEPWKPQGNLGDLKCDGYLVSEKTVFQSHAPEKQNPSKTKAKIQGDFEGAKSNFGDDMEKWVFVHNQDALPASCGALLNELRRKNNKVEIECWLRDDVLEFMMQLDPNKLATVFPELLSVDTEMLSKERDAVADLTAVDVVPKGGTERLDEALDALGADDVDIRRRILGSCVWLDPIPISRAISLLEEKGYDANAISSNLDRLENEGLVQVTSEHILPKDLEICQEAASYLSDEFIELLGMQ